jgi:hypothetical protein
MVQTILASETSLHKLRTKFNLSQTAEFSLEAARVQILAFMLANHHPERPSFGMITNSSSFVFVKLVKLQIPQYALSRVFSLLSPGNELYNVVSILKRIGSAIAPSL